MRGQVGYVRAAMAGASEHLPENRIIDGVNQRKLLLGRDEDGARDRFLYYSKSELQCVRKGPWKLRLPNLDGFRTHYTKLDRGTQETELYHLGRDLGETNNVADAHPDVVERLRSIARSVKKNELPEMFAIEPDCAFLSHGVAFLVLY